MQFCSFEKCRYPNFGKDKLTGLPYCRTHQTKRTDFDRRTIIQKAIVKEKALSTKVRGLGNEATKKAKEPDNRYELWYLARKYEMIGRCSEENCSNGTNKDHSRYFRWSCCHIVPKSLVPSVGLHFANFIELCQIHHQEFDATFERAAKMSCFKIAKAKFNTFKHLIPNEEMRKVNPYLKNEDTLTDLPTITSKE